MEVLANEEIKKMKIKKAIKETIENFIKSDEKVCILDNVNTKSIRSYIRFKKYKIRVSKRGNKVVLTKM